MMTYGGSWGMSAFGLVWLLGVPVKGARLCRPPRRPLTGYDPREVTSAHADRATARSVRHSAR
jgi:hypothetical protein